jgi:hypothetical protein
MSSPKNTSITRTGTITILVSVSIAIMLVMAVSSSVHNQQAFAENKSPASSYYTKSYDNKHGNTDNDKTYNNNDYNNKHNNDNNSYKNKYSNNGNKLTIYHDTSYVKGIIINDVDRSSPHLVKVILTHTDNNHGNTPSYVSVVAIGNEDKHTAGSTTISSHITDQKTVTVDLMKKNGKRAHIDNSNDVTILVVPTKVSSSILHH